MKHLLTPFEIRNQPAGRIMNSLIQEYVYDEMPTRWANRMQEEIPCHWFGEHPRMVAEDDGGYCSADGLSKYSQDLSRAMALSTAPAMAGCSLLTKVECGHYVNPHEPIDHMWATFSGKPFDKNSPTSNLWVTAPTFELAICRAALLYLSMACGRGV